MTNHPAYQVYRLCSAQQATESMRLMVFDQELCAQPGQFVMTWLPGVGEKPLCVASDQPFALAVAAVGHFSQALHKLQPGERVWVRGPYGIGFSLQGKTHVLVGGGYGAAPLLFLARLARAQEQNVVICLGARTSADLLMTEKFEALGCRVIKTTQDGSAGIRGLVTAALRVALEEIQADCVYACGPVPMLSAVAQLCRQYDMPAQLSYEALMRCGIGLCGSCELEVDVRQAAGIPAGWLTCKDGPVFFFDPGV